MNIFADNAYTSPDTLRKHYLNKIDRSQSAKRTRKIKSADPYSTKTMQERFHEVMDDMKSGREIRDKKFVEMDKAEGMKPKT